MVRSILRSTGEVRIIDYYQNCHEGISHYARVLRERGYLYDKHIAPTDIKVQSFSTGKSRYEKALELGIKFDDKAFEIFSKTSLEDGIDEVRSFYLVVGLTRKIVAKGLNVWRCIKRWNGS